MDNKNTQVTAADLADLRVNDRKPFVVQVKPRLAADARALVESCTDSEFADVMADFDSEEHAELRALDARANVLLDQLSALQDELAANTRASKETTDSLVADFLPLVRAAR